MLLLPEKKGSPASCDAAKPALSLPAELTPKRSQCLYF